MRLRGEAERSGRGELGVCVGGGDVLGDQVRAFAGGGQGEPFLEDAECGARFRESEKSPYPKSAEVEGEARSLVGLGGCQDCSPPHSPAPALVGGSRMARGLLQGARGVGPGFLGKSPPSAGMGLSGCPLPASGGGLGPRSPWDPGIAGSPDGNPAFDRSCPERLSP